MRVNWMASSFKTFSKKQKLLLTWWCNKKYKNYDAIICDGAIRSGKTICMSLSFVFWAFSSFNRQTFAICGKTVTSLKRNVIFPLIDNLKSLGFKCEYKITANYMDVYLKNHHNRFYFFGGKDEGSAALIQGITLAGVMLDEVALMPRSFVEQSLARCSVA
ncbi:MAG: terminase family protein, partial [Oscillospiraceae bacterium]|nr:terminase family protein [Oscillospiraceae bacterium]